MPLDTQCGSGVIAEIGTLMASGLRVCRQRVVVLLYRLGLGHSPATFNEDVVWYPRSPCVSHSGSPHASRYFWGWPADGRLAPPPSPLWLHTPYPTAHPQTGGYKADKRWRTGADAPPCTPQDSPTSLVLNKNWCYGCALETDKQNSDKNLSPSSCGVWKSKQRCKKSELPHIPPRRLAMTEESPTRIAENSLYLKKRRWREGYLRVPQRWPEPDPPPGGASSSVADGECPPRRHWREGYLRVPQRWPDPDQTSGSPTISLRDGECPQRRQWREGYLPVPQQWPHPDSPAGSSSSSRADGDCLHRRTWQEGYLRVPQRWPNPEPPRGTPSSSVCNGNNDSRRRSREGYVRVPQRWPNPDLLTDSRPPTGNESPKVPRLREGYLPVQQRWPAPSPGTARSAASDTPGSRRFREGYIPIQQRWPPDDPGRTSSRTFTPLTPPVTSRVSSRAPAVPPDASSLPVHSDIAATPVDGVGTPASSVKTPRVSPWKRLQEECKLWANHSARFHSSNPSSSDPFIASCRSDIEATGSGLSWGRGPFCYLATLLTPRSPSPSPDTQPCPRYLAPAGDVGVPAPPPRRARRKLHMPNTQTDIAPVPPIPAPRPPPKAAPRKPLRRPPVSAAAPSVRQACWNLDVCPKYQYTVWF